MALMNELIFTEASTNNPTIIKKRPKDMTPEELIVHKRSLHNEAMKKYLKKNPDKRQHSSHEYMRVYMREYMKGYRSK